MAERSRQIIPIGGGGFYRDPENLELEKYVLRQSGADNARVCFIPTASGEPDHYVASFYAAFLKLGCKPSVLTFFKRTPDLRSFLLNQDVIYVGGGNAKHLSPEDVGPKGGVHAVTLSGGRGTGSDRRRRAARAVRRP